LLLKISELDVILSGMRILHDINIHVNEGELVVIVGVNGAGKSTLLRTICGLNPSAGGMIAFNGEEIQNGNPYDIVEHGISMVPEGRQLFPELSARDNLLIGAYTHRRDKKVINANLDKIFSMFPVLKDNQHRIASTFSGGEQQMLSIGRCLMSEPKLLMIDEMSFGLAPIIIEALFDTIQELSKSGISILLVEQNAHKALSVADRAYVLEGGQIVLEGRGDELLSNERIVESYLGI